MQTFKHYSFQKKAKNACTYEFQIYTNFNQEGDNKMSKTIEKDYLSVKDIVATGLCSQAQAYNLMHANGFPSIKIFGALRVSRKDFNEWIEAQKVCN